MQDQTKRPMGRPKGPETTVVRVPKAIEAQVKQLVEQYRAKQQQCA